MLSCDDGGDRFAADSIVPLVNFVPLCGQQTLDWQTTPERRVLATKTHKTHKSTNRAEVGTTRLVTLNGHVVNLGCGRSPRWAHLSSFVSLITLTERLIHIMDVIDRRIFMRHDT